MSKKGAIILAGGMSARMGKNKALIEVEGKPLLRHVADKAAKVADEIIVAIGRTDELDRFAKVLPPSAKVLRDAREGQSPIIGMSTGLEALKSSYTVILPCDTPLVKKEVLEFLFCRASNADAAIPRWPNGRIESLQSVYRVKTMVRATREALKAGELSPVNAIKRLDKVNYVSTEEIKVIDPELLTFLNVNTPKDLRTVKSIFSKISAMRRSQPDLE